MGKFDNKRNIKINSSNTRLLLLGDKRNLENLKVKKLASSLELKYGEEAN